MPVDQQFNIINEKLQQLLKQQNRLKKENERLRTELEECKGQEMTYQQKLDELSQQILKLAGGDMNEKDKREFERKINQYIKEIDKCIAFLGQ
jgi:predicted  nucleic acid-binding Zn-ribbon protein